MFTHQQTFNMVYRGLAKQGFKRSAEGSVCKYRTSHGLKCAAGHVIPDDLYSTRMEFGIVQPKLSMITKVASRLVTITIKDLGHDLQLVRDLQECHDDSAYADELKEKLRYYAKNHELKIPRIYPSRAKAKASGAASSPSPAAGRSAA